MKNVQQCQTISITSAVEISPASFITSFFPH